MTTVIHPETLYFGTPTSLTVGGVEAGATTEPPTIEFEVEEFTPEFQGAGGPVKGTKIIRRVIPKANLRVNEITAEKLAWALPGGTSATTSTAEVVDGGTSELAAAASAGDTEITLEADGGAEFEAGQFVRIGASGPTAEYREIESIAGDTLTLARPLTQPHAASTTVTEVQGDGRTLITFRTGRVPSADFRPVVLRGEGLDGREMIVELDDCASAENQELPFADDDITGLNLALTAHYAPDAPKVIPMRITLL